MKLATATLLATLLAIVGIGCEGNTGSTVNDADSVIDRAGPEPPFSPEATESEMPATPENVVTP